MVILLKEGRTDEAIKLWRKVITNLKRTTKPISINELIYWVANQAFLENETELLYYASKVKFHNEQIKITRSAMINNRMLLKSCRSAKHCTSSTLADMQNRDKALESNLQRARNQQQAALQSLKKLNSRLTQLTGMISNMSARVHQEAMSIIQNKR
jgi:chromosome segregation ATPase